MNTEVEQEIARFNEVMRMEGDSVRASIWTYGSSDWIAVMSGRQFVEWVAPTNATDARLRLKDLRDRLQRGSGRDFCEGVCAICHLIRGSVR